MSGAAGGDWFDRWVNFHATLFGMDRDEDKQTFLAWRGLFLGQGFTQAELREASEHVALNPPKWRSEHLARLQARIRERRQEDRRGTPALASSYPDCPDCGGTGWVCDLPDLRHVVDREWTSGATMAVLCGCPWGRREKERHAGRSPLTFATYQRLNPGWADQKGRRRALLEAQRQAEGHARHVDKLFGPILRRLRDQTQT